MDPLDTTPAAGAPTQNETPEAGVAAPAATPTPAPAAAIPPGSGGAALGKRKRGRPRKLHVPAPGRIEKERRDDSSRANLDKANATLAEQRAQPKPSPVSQATLQAGAELFVRFLWMLSKLGARIFDGALRELEVSELADGAKEALPLIERFPFIASILRVLGFPLWMARTMAAAFSKRPKPAPQPAPLRAVPEAGKLGAP
jgi:hypothetical protein